MFRTHYAELSRLVFDSNNRLPLANELFSARLITLDCYNSATDNAPKSDMEKRCHTNERFNDLNQYTAPVIRRIN